MKWDCETTLESSFWLSARRAYKKTPYTTITHNPLWKSILIYLQSAMCFFFFFACFVQLAICFETKLQTVTWNYFKLFDFQLEWHKTIIAFVGWFGLVSKLHVVTSYIENIFIQNIMAITFGISLRVEARAVHVLRMNLCRIEQPSTA